MTHRNMNSQSSCSNQLSLIFAREGMTTSRLLAITVLSDVAHFDTIFLRKNS